MVLVLLIAGAGAALSQAQRSATPAGTAPGPARPDAQVAAQVPAPAAVTVTPLDVLMLVRTTLIALNQANFTGNYTVLHALASPSLQARTTPADLGDAFAELRRRNVDLTPALLTSPELTDPPLPNADGRLVLTGHIPTTPDRVEFQMGFQPIAGIWRLDGLAVAVRTPGPPPPRP